MLAYKLFLHLGRDRLVPTATSGSSKVGDSWTPTIVRLSGRVLLLCPLSLGLVYHFLLLLPLVLVMLRLLGCRYRPLVGEAVEDTKSEGGPPKNLTSEVN